MDECIDLLNDSSCFVIMSVCDFCVSVLNGEFARIKHITKAKCKWHYWFWLYNSKIKAYWFV